MSQPGIIKRAQLALRVFRGGLPAPRASKQMKVPLIWPDFRTGVPQWQMMDLSAYIAEGFNLNSLIYSAIMYKVRSLRAAPLRAYTGDPAQPDRMDAGQPLAQLVARPNQQMSWMTFQDLNTVYLNVAGNVWILCVRPRGGGLPEALYTLRPDRVFIVPQKEKRGQVMGYLYVPEGSSIKDGVPVLPQDMIHVKLPNPGDPFDGMGYGLSPLSSIAQSADVDNNVTRFIKLFFERGAMISALLKFNDPIRPEDIGDIKSRWREIYGGVDNWTDIGVLDQGAEYQRIGLTFDEMGFETLDDRNESRILGPLGVPGVLIGTRLGLNRAINANAQELRRMCWEDTLLPENALFEDEYRYFLQDDSGGFVAFDYSRVPALKQDVVQLAGAYHQLWSTGVPANQAARAVGLQSIGDIPGGDVGYIPLGVVPVTGASQSAPTNAGAPEAEQDATDAGKARKAAHPDTNRREFRVRHWKKQDRIAQSWLPKFEAAALKALGKDRREILALVSEAKSKAQLAKATVGWQDFLLSVTDYLKMSTEDNWRSAFLPVLKGVISDQGENLSATFGMQFDVANILASDWFKEYAMTFAQPINAVTEREIALLAQLAQDEGWTIPQMQARLELLFEQYMTGNTTPEDWAWYSDRMPSYRRELIARDQLQRSSNGGSAQLFKDWGVKKKEWLATQDDRVRDEHLAADGQVVGIDEPFDVGGYQMMFPGDDSMGAPIEMFIQDRCAVLPVID